MPEQFGRKKRLCKKNEAHARQIFLIASEYVRKIDSSFGMIVKISKGARRPAVLSGALLLRACFISLKVSAQSRDPECAEAPTSPLVVSVKDKGATGDGRTDDKAAIQAAIDEIAGTGGTVLMPNGTYMVDAVGKNRVAFKSDMTLKLSEGAALKAMPNDSERYAVLSISGASNVRVVGGTLEGERNEHMGKTGGWDRAYASMAAPNT